jgi:spore coat polysaccharide biosynthesis protein SpsF
MASKRLPGKVLADIEGRPMLGRMLDRLARLRRIDEVVVATSREAGDDPVAAFCAAEAVRCLRGHPTDVLDRIRMAARETSAQIVVRLTGDCPIIDPAVVDLCIEAFETADPPVDLVLNRLPWERTYPIGLDTEVVSRGALETAWREAVDPHQREHVIPFVYEHLERFRMIHVKSETDCGSLRWTVDEADDLETIRRIYMAFEGRDDFGWMEVVELYRRRPELAAINAGVRHRSHHSAEGPAEAADV